MADRQKRLRTRRRSVRNEKPRRRNGDAIDGPLGEGRSKGVVGTTNIEKHDKGRDQGMPGQRRAAFKQRRSYERGIEGRWKV